MPALASDLRRQLENVIIDAREKAEAAARAALKRLAVDAPKPFDHFSDEQRAFRNRLRARARQAGDVRKASGEQEIDQLTQELAYEYWHRMLFARFLAENHLLMHPDGIAVSLAECDELAAHEGVENGFLLAARYASRMLPQIFHTDDVLLEVDFPINDRLPLEKLLASLPTDTFIADDSLGWVYQFWQTKKKKEVNESGEKIDGRTLPAVTQLFTEPYMVKFLLHNTIGAWWAGKQGIGGRRSGVSEEELRKQVALPNYEFEYLRFLPDGTPAAGTFEGWPTSLKDFTMLDPCCGSGHFLVEAFNLLVPMRMQDEGLSAQDACEAVLAENLFGLELDPRCTQIAAFALALAAWKYPAPRQDAWATHSTQPDKGGTGFQPKSEKGGTGFQPKSEKGGTGFQPVSLGYRPLPPLNIACSGQSVTGKKEEWLALANEDSRLREGMAKLYDLFVQAPHLGSLIDPRREAGDLFVAGFAELEPLLGKALAKERVLEDADTSSVGIAAQGISKAAQLLYKEYTLVATNVPYLGRGDQNKFLREWSDQNCHYANGDLATVFLHRIVKLVSSDSTLAVVSPHSWWFLTTYSQFRKAFLEYFTWQLAATLGEEAWRSFGIRGPKATLLVVQNSLPTSKSSFLAIDALPGPTYESKIEVLLTLKPVELLQNVQISNPDHRITVDEPIEGALLSQYADGLQGISTADIPRFVRFFWEHETLPSGWRFFQGSVSNTISYGGRESTIGLEQLTALAPELGAAIRGRVAWGKNGVAVRQLRSLSATLFTGEPFDTNVAVILPRSPSHLGALWAFCSSPSFQKAVRRLDKKKNVTNGTMVKVPFDLAHWQSVSEKMGELPEPYSNDPTQWLFKGDIPSSTDPLQVSVARMLGYRWPEQPKEKDSIDAVADEDGVVCVPAVRSERPAAERLLDVLRAAYGSEWSDALLHKLLSDAGCTPGTSLDDWLRNEFFAQHCKRFHNRPFIWHIWDGRKDGFSCLVNYHKLNHKLLETLTYSYLQDWITAQTAAARDGKTGADLRLVAAQELQNKLKLILTGEPPYDIFVRWKPIEEQPIGWNPDLNDGVRMNIRPFMTAEVLRKKSTINWSKDRGDEPMRSQEHYPWFWKNGKFTGDRINDYHLTNAQKRVARENRVVEPTRIEREQVES